MVTEVFEESLRSKAGHGPDFPGSSGDRERGKFRPSATPRLTAIAIVNDDGSVITKGLETILNELLAYEKAIVLGLSLLTDVDLMKHVR